MLIFSMWYTSYNLGKINQNPKCLSNSKKYVVATIKGGAKSVKHD